MESTTSPLTNEKDGPAEPQRPCGTQGWGGRACSRASSASPPVQGGGVRFYACRTGKRIASSRGSARGLGQSF